MIATSTAAALPATQLFVFEFGPDASFEGQLGGALERLESGGTLRILEAMFIQRDAETAELLVIALHGDGAGGLIAPVLDFRLDPAVRRRATERALAAGTHGIPGEVLRELGGPLAPGGAMAAVLIEHVWAQAVQDAVAHSAGVPLVSEFVQARTLAELAPELRAAAARRNVSVQDP